MTETDKTARLNLARQKLKNTGTSTRRAGRDKIQNALVWLYRWGWSSPAIIDGLNGTQRRGLSAKLSKAGLVIETKTASGAITEDLPSKIVTLTDVGISLVEKHQTELLDYQTNPYKINQALLRHDLLTQKAILKNMLSGSIAGYLTPSEMAAKSQPGIKQPDAAWIMHDGRKLAIEIELTAKFERKLDEFVLGIISSLHSNNNAPARFDQCAIVSDSDAIISRYKRAFESGKKVNLWQKNTQSKWHISQTFTVPEWVEKKIQWLKLK